MRFVTSCLLALPLCLFAGQSFAAEPPTHTYAECTREPSEADLTAAKAAFQAGNVSFNEADYPRALLYWEDAFRRDCTAHPLLLNLARAYELDGQKQQAVIALEAFLAREPKSPERAQITRRVEVLKKQIESDQAALKALPPPPAAAPAPASSAPAPVDAPPPAESSKGTQVLPLVIAGVGGAVVIVGGIVWLGAAAEVRDFEKACPKDPESDEFQCPSNQADKIKPANQASKRKTVSGAVTAFVGLPLLAGGLIWFFASSPDKHPAAMVTPAVAPGFAGLTFDARF
jgi:tetratricopeptide (TPR) repeat protein